MAGIENSKNFLIKITNGQSPATYNSLGTQSNGSLSLSAERIDTTNKTTGNYRSGISGMRNFIANVDGFCNWPDTNGLDRLINYAQAGSDFNIQVIISSLGEGWQATVQATTFEINGAIQQATQYRAAFELSQGTPKQMISP